MVHSLGIGVDDVVRQRRFRDSIRLSTQQLPAPVLETNQGSQVEQVGVRYPLTGQRAEGFGFTGPSSGKGVGTGLSAIFGTNSS